MKFIWIGLGILYLIIGILTANRYTRILYRSKFSMNRLSKFSFVLFYLCMLFFYPIYFIIIGIRLGRYHAKQKKLLLFALDASPKLRKEVWEKVMEDFIRKATAKGHDMQPYKDEKNKWRCSKCGRFITLDEKKHKVEGTALERRCVSRK